VAESFGALGKNSPLFELALVLVRFDHVASRIVNANHGIMRTAEKLGVTDCITGRIRLGILQATEWQRVANQIDGAMVFARADFVGVHRCRF
jgi:hypothetical protein